MLCSTLPSQNSDRQTDRQGRGEADSQLNCFFSHFWYSSRSPQGAFALLVLLAQDHRIFSQTNLSLANSLLVSNQNNKDAQNSQSQQLGINLIQQAINNGKTATVYSPVNTLNWQNLATIYRDLINVGQGADKLAIENMQKATILDSANPQEYLSLGGIYYQLGQYENAIKQFQIAVNYKPDFPNAYYNLGHAYEANGNLDKALENYKEVRNLVANDKNNISKINMEIDTLTKKIEKGETTQKPIPSVTPTGNQQELNVNKSNTQLPKQPSPIKLPAPTGTNKTPTPTEKP